MKHQVSIAVSKQPTRNGVVSFKRLTIRERLLRHLLGNPNHVMVIAPGDSVQQIQIKEVPGNE
ncbi:hypothetical protein [Limosilactobacillus fermentum]|uniref:Uncharacterized protein n=1 Tax=Limosilactobacillus fermentum TaxID=1613 RepID=A0A843R2B1_LIMFE|nr:hypothetical protein [Limosilactobacillus fermentum]MPQ35066.1 hypothetical protein [Limosilactobacillus fermentum]